jgi:hypothetical protein
MACEKGKCKGATQSDPVGSDCGEKTPCAGTGGNFTDFSSIGIVGCSDDGDCSSSCTSGYKDKCVPTTDCNGKISQNWGGSCACCQVKE